MRLKSLQITMAATNQRLRTCVGNIFMLCLLSSQVWSYANIKQRRFVRQLNAETLANYEDSSMTNFHHQPHFTGNRAVIVQLLEWKFLDVAAECRNFLGPQGYAGVQLSPVLEHTVVKTSTLKHPWWERYEVISYRLASRSGDESEFWSMSRICNDHGVRIYADVVLNHMAAPLHFVVDDNETVDNEDFIVNTLLETNVNISQLHYANVSYTQVDFHRSTCAVLPNTQDANEIRNCQLNGHPDLDHSRAGVQEHIVKMLNKFVDMGVAGFRIDTAKYIWPIDLKNILKQVKNLNTEFNFKKNSRPFVYYDVFDLGLDTVSKTEYSTYGVVSEYLYPAELATIFNRKIPLSSLINWGPALGFLPHEDSLIFIDSHDTQRALPKQLGNNHLLTYKQRIKYIMANVFMLIHPYGAIKRIMSSYYFPDVNINQGPPVEDEQEAEEIRSPKFNEQQQCTKESGWVCEHRWPVLVNMLKVANYFKVPGQEERSIIHFQTNGVNQVAFCRGYKAFVAINNEPEMDFKKEVFACLEPGTYCDMVTGGKKEGEEKCQGKLLIINEQGYTKLHLAVADDDHGRDYEQENEVEEENEEESGIIESYGILVIYVGSKIQPKEEQQANDNEEQDKELKVEENETENQQPAALDENQVEIKADGTKLEETGDGNDPEDNDDQTKDQADEGIALAGTGGDDNDTDGKNDILAEENIDNPKEGEEEEVNADAEQPEEVRVGTSKEDDNADENQPEVNEKTDAEENGDDANDFEDDGEEVGKPDEAIETPNGQEEEKDNNAEHSKEDEEKEKDKEKTSADNETNEGDNSTNKEGEGEGSDEENVESKASAKDEEDDEGNTPTKDDAQEAIENVEFAEKSDENPTKENADDMEEELADTVDANQNIEMANDKADKEESNNEENGIETLAENENDEEEMSFNDQPAPEAPELEPLLKENSPEIIAAEASAEHHAENVVEEPKIEAVTAEDNTEHNQLRNMDTNGIKAEEQVKKTLAETFNNINPVVDTTKTQDILKAGILSNSKGDGNNG